MRILREIHFNDNSTAVPKGQPGYDRAQKVRPVVESVVGKCLTLYKPHRENFIDEAMFKFKGRSSLKQLMPKKPIKQGYKVWCSGVGVMHIMDLRPASRFTWKQVIQWRRTQELEPP